MASSTLHIRSLSRLASSSFAFHVSYVSRIMKALAWLVLLGVYILYLVAQTDTRGAYTTHNAVAHVFKNDDNNDHAQLHSIISYIRRAFVDQAWRDPVCGDGICEGPYEVPGQCVADCGTDGTAVRAVVRVASDFRHTRITEDVMRRSTRWNLCRRDDERARAGLGDDLCMYADNQPFPRSPSINRPYDLKVVDVNLRRGEW